MLCVDERRIFVTGLSNGAFMTSAVAWKYRGSDRRAAAPVAGIRDIKGCSFAGPVPVIAFHGTADPFVAYNGGLGPTALKLPTPDGSGKTIGQLAPRSALTKGPTVPQITADWAKRNGCGTKPAEEKVTSDVTSIVFPCPPGAEVELDRIPAVGTAGPAARSRDDLWRGRQDHDVHLRQRRHVAFFEAHPLRTNGERIQPASSSASTILARAFGATSVYEVRTHSSTCCHGRHRPVAHFDRDPTVPAEPVARRFRPGSVAITAAASSFGSFTVRLLGPGR